MTRYLEVGTEIAQRVRCGDLPPGALLPAVRVCARARDTTASTISRAYRYLAEGGVITLAARRRAGVAPDGAIAAARLLEAERVFRLAGSDDPALQILLSRAGRTAVSVGTRGSFPGLRALARGNADGAAIHLRHRSGSYNAPFARALLRARRPHLLHLWRREQDYSSRRVTRAVSPRPPIWRSCGWPNVRSVPAPGCCSTSCSPLRASPPTTWPAPSWDPTWRSPWRWPPASPTSAWACAP